MSDEHFFFLILRELSRSLYLIIYYFDFDNCSRGANRKSSEQVSSRSQFEISQ